MRLTEKLCKLFHAAKGVWVPRPQENRREGRKFFVAVWCHRCHAVRLFEYWKCNTCGQFYKPEVFAQHRADCKLVTVASEINRELAPTESDFTYLYDVAAKHGLTPIDCVQIARVEMGKSLAEFTRREVIEFADRIAGSTLHLKGGE